MDSCSCARILRTDGRVVAKGPSGPVLVPQIPRIRTILPPLHAGASPFRARVCDMPGIFLRPQWNKGEHDATPYLGVSGLTVMSTYVCHGDGFMPGIPHTCHFATVRFTTGWDPSGHVHLYFMLLPAFRTGYKYSSLPILIHVHACRV